MQGKMKPNRLTEVQKELKAYSTLNENEFLSSLPKEIDLVNKEYYHLIVINSKANGDLGFVRVLKVVKVDKHVVAKYPKYLDQVGAKHILHDPTVKKVKPVKEVKEEK